MSGFAALLLKAPALWAQGCELPVVHEWIWHSTKGSVFTQCCSQQFQFALQLASCVSLCLGSALYHSPFPTVAGNFPGVTSLLKEQTSNRTVISYNLNKRSYVLIQLLLRQRHRTAETQVTEVPGLNF